MSSPKVFSIGFHKTGTSSLSVALKHLGFRVKEKTISNPNLDKESLFEMATEGSEAYDAFRGDYWSLIFREVDHQFPGSKFILTMRPADTWIASVVDHFDTYDTEVRQLLYGAPSPRGHEDVYIKRYEQHNQEVLDYFRDRPDDLLVMRITEGDGWDKLCPFLGREVPSSEFPFTNKGKSREKSLGKLAQDTKKFESVPEYESKIESLRSESTAPEFLQVMPVFFVRDLNESEAFYNDKLGFQTLFRHHPWLIVLEHKGITIRLKFFDGLEPSPSQCDVFVKGIDALYQEYSSKGIVPDDGHIQTDWLTRDFSVVDLDENRITFMEPQFGV